jgi:hypothetical protein
MNYKEREQWFLDRIGKIVYRNRNGCSCEICEKNYQDGLYLTDKLHAQYLYEIEVSFHSDECPLRYFDTKEEVIEYEKILENG